MDRLVVSTVVHRSAEETFDFLLDFRRYPRYSRYLKAVDPTPTDPGWGDGGHADREANGNRGTRVREETTVEIGSEAREDTERGARTRAGTGTETETETEVGAGVGRPRRGAGAEYDFRLAWWKLGCSFRSRVVGAARPERIDWRLLEGGDAAGRWLLSPAPEVADQECVSAATRVRLEAAFDPDSLTPGEAVSLPDVVALEQAVTRVRPLVVHELKRMVRRAVRDLEGSSRDVTVTVEDRPDLR